MTLLQDALGRSTTGNRGRGAKGIPITPEMFEIAIGWAQGRVTMGQVMHAARMTNMVTFYVTMARALRWGLVHDKLKLVD